MEEVLGSFPSPRFLQFLTALAEIHYVYIKQGSYFADWIIFPKQWIIFMTLVILLDLQGEPRHTTLEIDIFKPSRVVDFKIFFKERQWRIQGGSRSLAPPPGYLPPAGSKSAPPT